MKVNNLFVFLCKANKLNYFESNNMKSKTDNQKDKSLFSIRLTALMGERNVTVKDLAKALDFSEQAVRNYKNDERKPDLECLASIANYFCVSSDYLLGLSDSASSDIDERQIHNMLGLSESTIKLLRQETEILYKLTNRSTPKEALEIQQKIRDKFFEYFDDSNLLVSYSKSLGIPQKLGKLEASSIVFALLRSPTFAILNTLVEDKEQREKTRHNNKMCSATSILEALENIFRQEKSSKNTSYVISKYNEEKQKYEIMYNEHCDFMTDGDDIYNLFLLDLQKVLLKRRDEYKGDDE